MFAIQIVRKFFAGVFVSEKKLQCMNFRIAWFHFQIFAGASIVNNCDQLQLLYCVNKKSFCLIVMML